MLLVKWWHKDDEGASGVGGFESFWFSVGAWVAVLVNRRAPITKMTAISEQHFKQFYISGDIQPPDY